MYSMNPLPVRVLPGALPGGFPPAAARHVDYDALVRLARRGPARSRAWHEAGAERRTGKPEGYAAAADTCAEETGETGETGNTAEQSVHAPAHPLVLRERTQPQIARQHVPPRAPIPSRPTVKTRLPIERRLEAFAAPCVEAIAESRQEFDGWTRFLVERAADFCCDRAVSAQGQWAVRLTLDPAILPDCTLHLSLSHFTLALRFEAQTNLSRQLVLHHEQTLKAQLAAVLAERGEARDIEIAVD